MLQPEVAGNGKAPGDDPSWARPSASATEDAYVDPVGPPPAPPDPRQVAEFVARTQDEIARLAPAAGTPEWWDEDLVRREQQRIAAIDAIGRPLEAFLAERSGPVEQFGPGPDGALMAFFGPPESFKSMAAVQLGLAGTAGGAWLGIELGEPRPFVYVAGEKSRATIRDRLERMTSRIQPQAPVRIIHREGLSFGDRTAWDRLVAAVSGLGRRTFVVCDTIASLAGPGFDENSGKDMAVVLAALRRLGDTGATVAAVHHPNKHGDGGGGARLRGHTSLWGEIDALVEFSRPDRAVEAGIVRIEPKDGDLKLLHVRWDRETFLLEAEAGNPMCTPQAVAAVVEALYVDSALSAKRIGAEFPGHGRTSLADKIAEAVRLHLVAKVGHGPATGYVPVPGVIRGSGSADDRDSEAVGRLPDDPTGSRTVERGEGGRSPDDGTEGRIVRRGGSIPTPRRTIHEPADIEPEDVDEPDDMGSLADSMFPDVRPEFPQGMPA